MSWMYLTWTPRSDGLGPCHTYSGRDATTVFALAQNAEAGDLWDIEGGQSHVLEFRPLLPNERPSCPQGADG